MKMAICLNNIKVFLVFLILFFESVMCKKYKNVFRVAFRFHALPENHEMLETHTHKKFNFQHYRETKMSQIIVFW